MALTLPGDERIRRLLVIGPAALAVVALAFHAAQPLTRPIPAVVAGERMALVEDTELGTGLWLPEQDHATYAELVAAIDANAEPDEPILALPTNPELYTLTGRPSPLWFFNTTFGLRTDDDIVRAEAALLDDPPAVVVHRPDDKYRTSASDRLLAIATTGYDRIAVIDGFEVYARPTR